MIRRKTQQQHRSVTDDMRALDLEVMLRPPLDRDAKPRDRTLRGKARIRARRAANKAALGE